jgi:hypothetical protein
MHIVRIVAVALLSAVPQIYPESAGTRTNRLPKREMGILLTE